MPVRAASPYGFEAALALKCRCGLPVRTALKQPWRSNADAGCQPTQLSRSWSGAANPHGVQAALALKNRQPARLRSSPGPQMLVRAACPHGFEAALALKCRYRLHVFKAALAPKCGCGLPARTAFKQPMALKCRCGLPTHG